MNELNERIDTRLMLAVALVQGLVLFALVKTDELGVWPGNSPVAETLLWTVSLVLPLGILLGANNDNMRRFLQGVALFSVIAGLLGGYAGYLWTPEDQVHADVVLVYFGLSGMVLCFKSLIYLQLWSARREITYPRVFALSWRNLVVAKVGCLLMIAVQLVLELWGALFNLVNIHFFSELFDQQWFTIPALTVSAGMGFVICRRLDGVIGAFSRMLRALCLFLLPLLAAIMLMFIVVLPFTGLDTLWETGHGTMIVLSLLFLSLLFFNAVHQGDNRLAGYPGWLEKLAVLGLVIAPLYALVALYGIWLRVDQHGFTVQRCWALAITLLALGLSSAYAVYALRARLGVSERIGAINIRFGWVLMAVLLLVNTPLLDFRTISVASQVGAWERGEVSDEELDVEYIARFLGRPGYLALQDLKEHGSEELAARIGEAEAMHVVMEPPEIRKLTPEDMQIHHSETPPPEELVQAIIEQNDESHARRVHLLPLDVDQRGPVEWLSIYDYQRWSMLQLWYLEDGAWRYTHASGGPEDMDFESELPEADIGVVPPRWNKIKIGDREFTVYEPAERD